MWEWIGRERYGVTDPKLLRMRYGVQVNSLGLTEAQPENNVQRIVLEALAVTLGRNARARAIQLPAWNEALGLPRPWDQQWSLRIQQVLAFETDLLEYPDIFEGSKVMDGLVAELVEGAREEMERRRRAGRRGRGRRLHEGAPGRVAPRADREDRARARSRSIGQNCFTETEDSPLTAGADGGILTPDPEVERERREALERVEGGARPGGGRARRSPSSPPPRADESRQHHAGDDRGGEGRARPPASGRRPCATCSATTGRRPASPAPPPAATRSCSPQIRARVDELAERIGHRPRILVGKPGLDGHSNGAEQIAVRARDVGMEVIYQGIRLTPEQIAASALRGGRRRRRPLDPLRLAPGADPRDRPPAARARASTRRW